LREDQDLQSLICDLVRTNSSCRNHFLEDPGDRLRGLTVLECVSDGVGCHQRENSLALCDRQRFIRTTSNTMVAQPIRLVATKGAMVRMKCVPIAMFWKGTVKGRTSFDAARATKSYTAHVNASEPIGKRRTRKTVHGSPYRLCIVRWSPNRTSNDRTKKGS
jgi:hypothetical protein